MKQLYDKDWKKVLIGIAILVAILFTVDSCNDKQYNQLKGEYNVLNEQYEIQKDGVKTLEAKRAKEKDSLTKIIEDSKKRYSNLETEYQKRKVKSAKNRERVKNLDNIEIAEELNQIYDTKDAVATDTSVNLNGELPNQVLQTVYDADECQEDIATRDGQLTEMSLQLVSTQLMLDSAEKTIAADKVLQNTADKNINNLEKQVSKLQTKSTIKKILIPAAFITGAILGYEIAK